MASAMLEKIISGGQTGADIAALDVAIHHNFPHGGWCPKGRKSLDGAIDTKYQLRETPSGAYPQRTEWNVRDSDVTVVFTFAEEPSGGSLKTIQLCRKHGRPFLHISKACTYPEVRISKFVEEHGIITLNVAGSRESKDPGTISGSRKYCRQPSSPSDTAILEFQSSNQDSQCEIENSRKNRQAHPVPYSMTHE